MEARCQLAPARGSIMASDAAIRRHRHPGTASRIARAATVLGDQLSLGRTGQTRRDDLVPSTVHRSVPAGEHASCARSGCCGRWGPLGFEPLAGWALAGDPRPGRESRGEVRRRCLRSRGRPRSGSGRRSRPGSTGSSRSRSARILEGFSPEERWLIGLSDHLWDHAFDGGREAIRRAAVESFLAATLVYLRDHPDVPPLPKSSSRPRAPRMARTRGSRQV